MNSATRLVTLLGCVASFGNALPVTVAISNPNAFCTQKACPFSYVARTGANANQCGEVDAASRMPTSIWNDQRAVTEYVEATIKYYTVGGVQLENKVCDRKAFVPLKTQLTSWTTPELMRMCDLCGCTYPACPDVPDDPSQNVYCSLCGPKYNTPVIVTIFRPGKPQTSNECGTTFSAGGNTCVRNPGNPINPVAWTTGQNHAACQTYCDTQERGGCCEASLSKAFDCKFYPEGTSVPNATMPRSMTLPCIQPPPPPVATCGKYFGPGGNDCVTDVPPPGGEGYITWTGLTAAQAKVNCAAEGKTGCCSFRSDGSGRTTFYANGYNVPNYRYPNDATLQCTEAPPPPPRPPANCQAFGGAATACSRNPDPTAPDREPTQWLYVEPEVCFAECEKEGQTGCCQHQATGVCAFFAGGQVNSVNPPPSTSAGLCLGPSCTTGLDFACGAAKREGVFQCGQCVGKAQAQLTQCSEAQEEAYCVA